MYFAYNLYIMYLLCIKRNVLLSILDKKCAYMYTAYTVFTQLEYVALAAIVISEDFWFKP